MEMKASYLYSALAWAVWCAVHSALISIPVTEYLKKRLGDGFRFYRLFYNAFSLATVIPVLLYSISIPQQPIFRWEGSLGILQYLLLAVSIGLFILGGRHYSLFQFLGISQVKSLGVNPTLSENARFVATGIHRVIRHPWYLGGILIVWARDLGPSAILNNLVIDAYFVIGAVLEERKLIFEFGESYREYQRKVSMFLPYKWLKAKLSDKPQR